MKKTVRILIPILLAVAVIVCTAWYLFVYDQGFTRDMLLSCARYSESKGNHGIATWFYNRAYAQSGGGDEVAIELAEQYISGGNFTKAEYTLTNAISDGGGVDVYIALCNTYVRQDKLLDAVNMLNSITNEEIKAELEQLRPKAPSLSPEPGFYSQYISVTVEADAPVIYVSNNGEYPTTASTPYSEPIALPEGETVVYAIAVADNGLVSPAAIHPYTIGGVIERVEFADSVIEEEIRKILEVGSGKELYTNNLWEIREFTVPAGAQSYVDLKNMLHLEQLTVENGVADQIQHISSLSKLSKLTIKNTPVTQAELKIIGALPQLKELTLSDADLSGIAPLSAAVGLEKLDISNNTVRGLDAVKSMPSLKELNISHNAATELSALAACTNLIRLDAASNNLRTLAPIGGLTNLTHINASTNLITELGDISKLTALKELDLSFNSLTSAPSLSGCTSLTDLNISDNLLTDLSSVSGIDSLMHLNFSNNQLTQLPDFSAGSQLVSINGSNNKLSSLDNLSGLSKLNTVDMDYNAEISSVKPLANCPVLIRVNVFATKVTDVKSLTDQSIEVNYNPVQ